MSFKTKHERIVWAVSGATKREWTRNWYTQPTPFKAALPFAYVLKDVSNAWGFQLHSAGLPEYPYQPGAENNWFFSEDRTSAFNAGYDDFRSKISDTSTWANNLIEANQAIASIVSRAGQLGRFVTLLRKGRVVDAASQLRTPVPRGARSSVRDKVKSLSDQWLEWHFGWEPLVQDIGNAIEVLQKADFGLRRVRGKSRYNNQYDYRLDNSSNPDTHLPGEVSLIHRKVRHDFLFQADVRISNPNAYLANQMGFVNPLSVAWELVPFSFVVDWFGNVGQVLSSMTDFVGLELQNSFTTHFQDYTEDISETQLDLPQPFTTQVARYGATWQGVACNRYLGIQGPSFALKPFKGFSVTRGATAIALLLQKL